jgi:hypothetical protein
MHNYSHVPRCIPQFNEIGEKGAEYIANGLAHCSGLAELSIYNNQISDSGVRALSSSLAVSTLYRYGLKNKRHIAIDVMVAFMCVCLQGSRPRFLSV